MLLTDLKNHLRQHRRVSLLELSKRFSVDSTIMRDMLCFLMQKGLVCQFTKTAMCGTRCHQCGAQAVEMYEWAETS